MSYLDMKTRNFLSSRPEKVEIMSLGMYEKTSIVSRRFGMFGRGVNPAPFREVSLVEQGTRLHRVAALTQAFNSLNTNGIKEYHYGPLKPLTAEFALEFLLLFIDEIVLAGMSTNDLSLMGSDGTEKPFLSLVQEYYKEIEVAGNKKLNDLPRRERKKINSDAQILKNFMDNFRVEQAFSANESFYRAIFDLPYPSVAENSPLFAVTRKPYHGDKVPSTSDDDRWIVPTWKQLEGSSVIAPPDLSNSSKTRHWLRCDIADITDLSGGGRIVTSYTPDEVFDSATGDSGIDFFFIFRDVYDLLDGSQWSTPWRLW